MSKKLKFCYGFLLLMLSCLFNKSSDIVEKNGLYYIKPRPAYISHVKIVDWHVGALRRTTVSKGMLVKVALPNISREILKKFVLDYSIDSWLVKVKKKSAGINKSLKTFSIPIINEASLLIKGSAAYRINQRKKFIVRIYYVDAALSERFEKFLCPGLGHNLVLRDVELLKRKSFDRLITVQVKAGTHFNSKVFRYQISANKINGGKSLKGEYSIEIALYSAKKKKIFSNFYDLANIIKVSLERTQVIKGCSNFQIPRKEDEDQLSPKEIFSY